MPRVLCLFLDGVGLGEADPARNPFFRARLPTLSSLLGGTPPHGNHPRLEGLPRLEGHPPTGFAPPGAAEPPGLPPHPEPPWAARLFGLDATLGVEGLPQSGTGQITLLTGINAAREHGSHFGPWPPVGLRPLLERENLFRALKSRGRRVRFANAYPDGYPDGVPSRRVAAPPLAARSAGVLVAGPAALRRGEAVASEIDNEGWRRWTGRTDFPRVTPEEAGGTLAHLSTEADLTFFAHYATDTAGHRGGATGAIAALERVDAFLAGIMATLDPETVVVIASDHGNVEALGVGHTRNPALGMVIGAPDVVARFPSLGSLMDLVPAVMETVG